MVRGVACLITWPTRESSKKLPVPVLDVLILLISSSVASKQRSAATGVHPAALYSRSCVAASMAGAMTPAERNDRIGISSTSRLRVERVPEPGQKRHDDR